MRNCLLWIEKQTVLHAHLATCWKYWTKIKWSPTRVLFTDFRAKPSSPANSTYMQKYRSIAFISFYSYFFFHSSNYFLQQNEQHLVIVKYCLTAFIWMVTHNGFIHRLAVELDVGFATGLTMSLTLTWGIAVFTNQGLTVFTSCPNIYSFYNSRLHSPY